MQCSVISLVTFVPSLSFGDERNDLKSGENNYPPIIVVDQLFQKRSPNKQTTFDTQSQKQYDVKNTDLTKTHLKRLMGKLFILQAVNVIWGKKFIPRARSE